MEIEQDFYFLFEDEEEDVWKCRKHPSRRRSGVCPSCLRDRLLLLCPDCARVRPCSCFRSSSSSSSSLSSRSSMDPARSSVSGAIGSIGRVSNLIDVEPAFRRSRSVAPPFLRQRSEREEARIEIEKVKKWENLWGLLRAKEEKGSEIEKLPRSRSVIGSDERLKWRKWNFLSPMRAFRQKKMTRVVQERSPLCQG